MSQSPGGGSERHHHSEQNKMAAAYTGGYPAPSSQTLPSFRELLPEHLHDEIDQAAYYIAQQSRSTDRNHTSDAANSYGKSRPSLPFLSTSGPNPILPPLRDLQSSPRHHQQPDRSIRSLDEVPSRSDSRAGRGYGSSQISKDEDHRHHSAPGGGVSNTYGTHMSYDASRYSTQQQQQQHQSQLSSRSPYQGTSYANSNHSNQSNDYEYSVPASSPPSGHAHTTTPTSSNFGVMGSDQLDSRGKRRRGNLPKPVTDVLRSWFHEHLDHPYPTEEDKQVFMSRTGLSLSQISNWFINARRRQLPALRNQLRNTDGDHIPRGNSPLSDGDASTSPPHSHLSRSPTRSRHK